MKITAVILTHNEELHLERCILSLREVVSDILVVDSYSSDDTLGIALGYGARIIQNTWVNYAAQFNFALTQLSASTEWVLRIDADETLTVPLRQSIKALSAQLLDGVAGVYWGRRMAFQGRLIRHGGVFPVQVCRLFRKGHGECENRWMDEHIKLVGPAIHVAGEMIDDNLNSLSWWIDKHNRYASREAVDLLNLECGFFPHDSVAALSFANQASRKRWIKEYIYARLPLGIRAFAYFLYRYVFRLGFLDGSQGTAFHFLQGFWYRYLVDAKVNEVRTAIRAGTAPRVAVKQCLGLDLLGP